MLLLVNYLTEQEWKQATIFSARLDLIGKQVEVLYKNYANALKNETVSFKIAKKNLESLLGEFTRILMTHTQLENPYQALLEAERYAVWLKGRQCYETQFFLPVKKEDDTLNDGITFSERPVYDQELLGLDYLNHDNFWFQSLKAWQQNFINDNRAVLSTCSIPAALRHIPGLANASFHHCQMNNKNVLTYFRHATQVPIDLLKEKKAKNEQFRITCLNIASQIRQSIEKRESQKTYNSLGEIIILTQSFLSPGKAAHLKARLMSDASDNDTNIYTLKEKAIRLFQNALANPDELIQADNSTFLFFTPEEREKKKQLYYKDFLNKWGLMTKENKTVQYKHYRPLKITLLSTNHPLNVLRHLEAYSLQNTHNELNTALLLGVIARYLTYSQLTHHYFRNNNQWDNKRLPQLLASWAHLELDTQLSELIERLTLCENGAKIANHNLFIIRCIKNLLTVDRKVFLDKNIVLLLDALQTLLSIPNGQGVLSLDERHKPQLRSIAEIVLVNCLNGIVWLACKSGKDRTGGAAAAADAAAIYYQQKKKFPHYQDNKQDREDYLTLLKEVLNSGHQQHIAFENAPGAQGLMRSIYFLPFDLKLDKNKVLRETQLASLNKLKAKKMSDKPFFYHKILKEGLRDIKDKTQKLTIDPHSTVGDWNQNWTHYFINGKSVATLRKHQPFENENDLSRFIGIHLLQEIQEETLKKYYEILVLYAFHQEGFLQAFSTLSLQTMNKYHHSLCLDHLDVHVNLSWLDKSKSIQIEEIGYAKKKKNSNGESAQLLKNEALILQTYSCIGLKFDSVKNRGYQLDVKIQNASVDCFNEPFKSIFLKELNFLEVFIGFIQSLLIAIKRHFDERFKKSCSVLDEKWLIKANSIFFQKPEGTDKWASKKDNEREFQNDFLNIRSHESR
ncbi:hypothetical protein [Rickettsiella grylli]|uniref:Uncharacterized protein n=1 Tax=Rickettsiella grylli TaxID=59196 RepID=A8PNR0_9COXI|nr:hypothetical protein [Rickettsiella grylli]EDP46025.1 hypothetical protein RICGR_1079 [Rickettsiella grylli]